MGSCKTEGPLLNITKKSARHAQITSGMNREFNNVSVSDQPLTLPLHRKKLHNLREVITLCFNDENGKITDRYFVEVSKPFSLDLKKFDYILIISKSP